MSFTITRFKQKIGLSPSKSFVQLRRLIFDTIVRAGRVGRLVRYFVVNLSPGFNINSIFKIPTKRPSVLSNKKRTLARNHAATTIQIWWRAQLKRSGNTKFRSGKLTSLIPELENGSAKQETNQKSGFVSNVESHVGSAMREITSNRIVLGIMIAVIITVFFTYSDQDSTMKIAMSFLHAQTSFTNEAYNNIALDAARKSSVPSLYYYKFPDGNVSMFDIGIDITSLRDREIINFTLETTDIFIDENGNTSTRAKITNALISSRGKLKTEALVEFLGTLFLMIAWVIGVMSFVGPVTTLVVVPIERMIYLLEMLMMDPLGYQDTFIFSKFMKEEDELAVKYNWTKDVMKGMET